MNIYSYERVFIMENDTINLQYKLENLFCQSCSSKIEKEILEMKEVKNGFYNFSTQILNLNLEKNVNIDLISSNIKKIVDSKEEGVNVILLSNLYKDLKFKLNNLFCQNCSSKIENKILELKEVKNGNYNFSTQILNLKVEENTNNELLLKNIQQICDSYEDGVKAEIIIGNSHEHNHDHSHHHHEDYSENKIHLAINIIGTLMFFILISFPNFKFKFVGFLIAYLLVGSDILLSAFKNLKNKDPFDENFLMTIATVGAFGIGEYPEAVAVMIFYKVGEFFQSKAVSKSRKSISSLLSIKPEWANIEINGKIIKVKPHEIKIGDKITVYPGENVPLDGKIVKGESSFDTKALTGESIPSTYSVNDDVLSGTVNIDSTVEIIVTKSYENSTVAKILNLVENASIKKAKTEKFITTFSRYYTPIVVFFSAFVGLILPIFIGDFSLWFYRALIFLVISCPCALVVSIPLSYFGGIGRASKNGILIKGSNYLEALTKVKKIVVDKTGTLTKGNFTIKNISPITNDKLEDLIYYAVIGENGSNHPIANAIKNYKNIEFDLNKIEKFEVVSGLGTKTIYNSDVILVGNKSFLTKNGINVTSNLEENTIVHVSVNNNYLGFISLIDEIKEDSFEFIKLSRENNLEVIMLSGDTQKTCENVSKNLGISKFFHSLLPSDKVQLVENELSSDYSTIFVGDGINDAPVLKRVDIGISMGGVGSDAAIEASDIVIMDDKLSKINKAIDIAKKTKSIVIQNIIFALTVKIGILALGLEGHASMWEAIFADVGVALIAIFNSIRALKD